MQGHYRCKSSAEKCATIREKVCNSIAHHKDLGKQVSSAAKMVLNSNLFILGDKQFCRQLTQLPCSGRKELIPRREKGKKQKLGYGK